ncbi:MAG: hypothetical protein KBF98_08450 [Rhodoferax sp.]|nr:hypothetical protein [Rhodoferax sp.]
MNNSEKRPGRPPKAGGAMTQAQRQRVYRNRQEEAKNRAAMDPTAASTKALVACIAHQCNIICNQPEQADLSRELVGPVISELCRRHRIKLPSMKEGK